MAGKPRVFVARKIPIAGLQRLRAAAEITVWPGAMAPPAEALLAQLAGCAGLLSLFTDRVDGALLDAVGPQLRVVSQMAVGVDNFDLDACTARGIPVGHTPGHCSFYAGGSGLLFAGDAFKNMGGQLRLSEGFNTWDERAALHSAVRLSALEPAVMCMGHGLVLRAAAPAMQRAIAAHKRRLQIG